MLKHLPNKFLLFNLSIMPSNMILPQYRRNILSFKRYRLPSAWKSDHTFLNFLVFSECQYGSTSFKSVEIKQEVVTFKTCSFSRHEISKKIENVVYTK